MIGATLGDYRIIDKTRSRTGEAGWD